MTVSEFQDDRRIVEALLVNARTMIDPVLHAAVESMREPLGHMAGYHFGWWDASGAKTAAVEGKALRPALTLACAAAYGADPTVAAEAAAAVELLHNSSLVYDDIMDADPVRRGRAAVWRVWGIPNAILLGDGLHAVAVGILAGGVLESVVAEAITRLTTASLASCRGQYYDCDFETRSSVGVDEYLSMAAEKTGALTACACALGALCAGADGLMVARMNTLGRELGIAFQLADDVLGIYGDAHVTGKPVGSDLARRKKSYPVIAALELGALSSMHKSANIDRLGEPLAADDIATTTQYLKDAGVMEQTLRLASDRVREAMSVLPPQLHTGALEALADFAIHRNR
ncbi:putative polyprenyl diphosphate synthase [Nocardia brasiliensis NBRC 14402]|uniref:polyprenyl synthetase family protein n=1 Tax=Nocardia brasiliensis TaxID=37326 RepID=UPI0002F4C238|nr:polyprenyl synthetase family protein [Nocardia brasiliensis]ASF12197.1 polyprenyl synthetase family protein [Nocardia brasiliensis]GAJ85890.1 putative polyprenyl diphosphate synthase [Nocardia brasiliensis NBRC 14402]SUB53117.1 Farnesyl diphosphate synthase [Nocardia brasiliensis]